VTILDAQGNLGGSMPFANNAGVRIHYEIEGAGPPLVLQHGFTARIEAWRWYGYVSALRGDYRLILIDARGHGQSDKPHDEASYALDRRIGDVTAVLDALGVERAPYWGYSMGGWMGFGMAKFAPERLNGLVIRGAHPYGGPPGGGALHDWINDGIAHGRDALIAGSVKRSGPISEAYARDLREADLEAWRACIAQPRENMESMLANMTMPCCIYVGEADERFASAKQIPNARFFSLPGLDHLQGFLESSKVMPQAMEFLRAAG
jgi:pimeloyl-ACP methyl ester carboxylesterase